MRACLTRRAPTKQAASSAAAFPITLTDATGTPVTVPARPLRLVSIAPTVTEMLYDIGAGKQLVGDTEQCDYPAEAKKLPKVGQWWQPSAERVLALKPDLVLAQRGNTLDSILTLRKAGLPVFTIAPKSIADIETALRHLGQLTGQQAGAGKAVQEMRARLALAAPAGGHPRGGEAAHGVYRRAGLARLDGGRGDISG